MTEQQARLRIHYGLQEDISAHISAAKGQRIKTIVCLTSEQQRLLTALVDSLVETHWGES
jgi:hypothetical protein